MIHENIELTGSFNVNGTLVIPTHAATASALSATGSIYNDSTDNIVKLYTGTEWIVVGDQTGQSAAIEYLVVAGGGGGGTNGGAGGGAGGYRSSHNNETSGGGSSAETPLSSLDSGSTITVTVGAGGAGSSGVGGAGVDGTDSSIASTSGTPFTTVTSTGGGGGAKNGGSGTIDGRPGGSGGGAGTYYSGNTGAGGAGTAGQGYAGGDAQSGTNTWRAAGGGGAGGQGAPGTTSSPYGGVGGAGVASTITGTSVIRASGGSGYQISTATPGGGGSTQQNGTANTGGGGGSYNAGGSGVAIFAYDSGSLNCAGGIVGDAGSGRKYHQFNSSGTFKVGSSTDFQLPATDNLKLHLNAANFDSYPGTGTTWNDLSGNNNNFTLDGSGISWNSGGWFELSDGGLTKTGGAVTTSTTVTFALWIKTTDIQSLFYSDDNSQFYIGAYRVGNKEYYSEVGSPTYYQDLVEKSNIYDNIRTGNWIFVEFKSCNFSAHGSNNYINKYSTYTFSSTQVGAYYIYDKNLSAAESLQLYNATKTNFT